MTCGADAQDKGGRVHSNLGCGKGFNWDSAKPCVLCMCSVSECACVSVHVHVLVYVHHQAAFASFVHMR